MDSLYRRPYSDILQVSHIDYSLFSESEWIWSGRTASLIIPFIMDNGCITTHESAELMLYSLANYLFVFYGVLVLQGKIYKKVRVWKGF